MRSAVGNGMRLASGRSLRTAALHSAYASSVRTGGFGATIVVTSQMTLIATRTPNPGHANLARAWLLSEDLARGGGGGVVGIGNRHSARVRLHRLEHSGKVSANHVFE